MARRPDAGPGIARGVAGASVGRRPAAGARAGPGRPARPGGAAPGGTRAGAGDAAAGAGEAPPRERHTRRGFRKATPGSTTYDEAADAPLDPEWEGGSWYGPTSRTYWTINPREYADPRKHGPEYQARARRAARAEDDAESAGGPARRRPPDRDATRRRRVRRPERRRRALDRGEPSWGWSGSESTTTDGGDAGWGTHGWAYEEAAGGRRRGAAPSAVPRRR